MPILGVIASSTRQGLVTGSYESISSATVTESGGSSFVEFTTISNAYKFLRIIGCGRTTHATTVAQVRLTFNGDNGTNYRIAGLYGGGLNTTGSYWYTNYSSIEGFEITGANSAANFPGSFIMDIFDYANTNKLTSVIGHQGRSTTTGNDVRQPMGFWNNAAVVNTIRLSPAAGNFVQNSTFSLYGIK